MAVDRSVVGTVTGRSRVVIERGPVANFADVLEDDSSVYRNADAAKQHGFPAIPAPPTFPFAMEHWGRFEEIQPDDGPKGNPVGEIVAQLMKGGGLLLHGEQAFEYHRPVYVGDVLIGEGRVVDVYEKESKGKLMTFVVTETVWKDDKSGDPVVTSRFNLIHRA